MAAHAPVHLSPVRRDLLDQIATFHADHGYAPSIRELSVMMDWASIATTWAHLDWLRQHGLVSWVPGDSRTLHLTSEGRECL